MGWYEFVIRCVGRPLFHTVLRARLTNAAAIPEKGPAIIASNHLGGPDVLVVAALIDRPIIYPAKAELFEERGVKRLLSWWLRSMGQIPIDRAGGRGSVAGLRPLVDVLRNGGLVGIFPEGTRSPDGRLYRGHTGVARLALAANVPVIPIGMSDTHLHGGFLGLPSMRHARIEMGEPLDFSALSAQHDDPAIVRQVTDRVMAAIQQISGQTYVDVYASRVKSGALDAEAVEGLVRAHPGDKPAPLAEMPRRVTDSAASAPGPSEPRVALDSSEGEAAN
jgi:1-acyl-sn-glycerol-3-phosphate acyltransferase